MGIVREPDGVDFVVSSGRWSPEVTAEVAEFFHQLRQQPSCLLGTVARAQAAADNASPESSDRKPVAASS